ncbi:MAG: aminoacyl-tRNA hydrolase [Deltaproteobacteria bacterium]
MLLVVGLGNPGSRYQWNRHNVGFRVADRLAAQAGVSWSRRFDGELGQGDLGEVRVSVLKPETFMNLSGDSVAAAAKFFKLGPEDVVVVHDELDLPFGRLHVKRGGGHAGHNGLRSIAERLGSADFVRVRVGVGRPPPGWDAAGYVLGDFTEDEEKALEEILGRATEAAALVAAEGVQRAMNRFNTRPGKSPDATGST